MKMISCWGPNISPEVSLQPINLEALVTLCHLSAQRIISWKPLCLSQGTKASLHSFACWNVDSHKDWCAKTLRKKLLLSLPNPAVGAAVLVQSNMASRLGKQNGLRRMRASNPERSTGENFRENTCSQHCKHQILGNTAAMNLYFRWKKKAQGYFQVEKSLHKTCVFNKKKYYTDFQPSHPIDFLPTTKISKQNVKINSPDWEFNRAICSPRFWKKKSEN